MKKYEHFQTNAIRTQVARSGEAEHSVPIYATSSYVFQDAEHARALFAEEVEGNLYTRYNNPNNDEFVAKMCLLEGAESGVATATGMAAIFLSIASFVRAGDHVVACRSVFGSTHAILTNILPRWGITFSYVDINKPETWEQHIQENTKMIVLETPSNPGLDLVDLEWAGKLAQKHGIILNVDNCFATPYLQNPISYGAGLVSHSATKFIDGQGRTLGGIVLGTEELIKEVRILARNTGPSMSPFNGWILSKSLETLAIRMDRHCENALAVAEFLESRDDVAWVRYPFLPSHPNYELAKKQMRLGGGIVTFEPKGGVERAKRFFDATQMFSLSSNLGDSRSILTIPAITTHSKLTAQERLAVGITDGAMRLSVGLEHRNDIIAEITQALDKSA